MDRHRVHADPPGTDPDPTFNFDDDPDPTPRFFKAVFLDFSCYYMCVIQHCFICRPSDSTVSEDARIEPRTVANKALTARRSNHSARSHPPQDLHMLEAKKI